MRTRLSRAGQFKSKNIVATVFVAVLIFGCSDAKHSQGLVGQDIKSKELKKALENPETIAFDTVNTLILQSSCVKCHNEKDRRDGVDLSSAEALYQGAKERDLVVRFAPDQSPIFTSLLAKGARHMPPLSEPQLSEEQIQLMYLWIKNGGKRTAGEEPQRGPSLKEQLEPYFVNPGDIDYQVVRKHILGPHCIKCHSLTGDAPDRDALNYGADMTTYSSLFLPELTVIVKGMPTDSSLFRAPAITFRMPPEAKGYDPLHGLQLKLLRLWILNCAIESKEALGDEELNPNPEIPGKVRECQ